MPGAAGSLLKEVSASGAAAHVGFAFDTQVSRLLASRAPREQSRLLLGDWI